MLPFFNMRLYRNGNMATLQPFIERMKKNELTLENILEEDDIIQDLKTNPNSQFINMLSTDAIRKLIDYATKMPKSDEKNIGYKYPFNATEILCCDNNAIMEKIMNEIRMGEDSDEEEDEKEEGEKENKEEDNSDEEKKKEENEEYIEVKEDENKQQEPEKKIKEKEGNEEPKNEEEHKQEEPKKEEPKEGVEQPKPEEPKKEEIKTEEPKKEESKVEEPKAEETKKEEPKEEQQHSKPKEFETVEQNPEDQKKEVPKEEGQPILEEPKKEKEEKEAQPEKNEEEKPEEEPPKPEELPKEEPKKEEKPEEPKKEEEQKEELPVEILNKSENAEEPKQEMNEQKNEEENAEEPKQEENENQRNEEENEKEEEQEKEDEEPQPKEIMIIYDNVDYLLGFLKESEETKSNYVLVGYFYKILNHLFNTQQSKIVQYLFDYPKKNEFDVLGAIIKNMKRKSMGELVNKLLLFQEEGGDDFLPKRLELLEKVLEELKETKEEDKYECICSTLESTFYNKGFFIEFMKEPKLLELLYNILENTLDDTKKLIAVLRLLINIHENILKNEEDRCTISVAPENPMDFLSMFNGTYGLDETTQKEPDPELQKTVEILNQKLIELIEKNKFNFMNDLDDYSSQDNAEFMSTYQVPQKKLGMKKLTQIEFFRTILDILVNVYAKYDIEQLRNSVLNIIKIAQEKKIFWKMHKLFFDFPFSNLYQSFYLQIFDIILNEHSPEELIKNTLIEKEGENENNLIEILIKKVVNEMEFKFSSGRTSFHPNYSFEVSILNKITSCNNEYVKELIQDNKNLSAFDKILGQEIDSIFNQKLLLNPEKDIQMGPNIALEKEEAPLKYFCKKNFMELLEEDNTIYSEYLKGEDYEKHLEEKNERVLQEQEERKKQEEKNLNEGVEEEMVPGLGDSINIVDDNNNNEVEEREQEEVQKEEEEKEKDSGGEEEVSEETEEEKSFNDVNYWKTEISPDDNIMSAILNDLD